MAAVVQQTMRAASFLIAWAVVGSLVMSPAHAFQLGILAVSVVICVAIVVATVIALTGQSFW